MTLQDLQLDNLLYRTSQIGEENEVSSALSSVSSSISGGSFGGSSETSATSIVSGELTGNLIVNKGFIRSKDYVEGSAGWTLNDDGTVQIKDLTLIGGIIQYNKTSFTDSTNNGYYISSDGIYFGSASDASKFKYDISAGTIDFIGTISSRSTATLASAIDASGHFADTAISTASKTILGDFTFGVSGALQIGEYEAGVSGDVKISPTGILARDKNGDTTFSINGTTGVAVLNGLVVGTNVDLGTAQDSAGVTTIIGDTVTTSFVNALNVNAATINASVSITSPTITGGSIAIGSDNSIFKADSNGIYLGNATFGSARFSVDMDGALKASSATITGALTATAGSVINGTYLTDATVDNNKIDISAFMSAPSDENLVGYWSFDEGTGTDIKDTSSEENTGTITGATFVSGVSGTGLSFDGTDDIITFTSSITLTYNSFSVSWWMKRTETGYENIFSASLNGQSGQIEVDKTANALRFESKTNNVYQKEAMTTGLDLTDGEWHHFVIVSDTDEFCLYSDGIKTYTTTANTDTADQTFKYIGSQQLQDPYVYGDYFKGSLDEIRFYNRALSLKEVQALYLYINPNAKNIITAQRIAAHTVTSAEVTTGELITLSAQIKDAIITNAKISDLDVSKLNAGSITSKAITLAVSAGEGDAKIQAGKTDFDNTQSGFILGIDDSDSDKAKFYIGNDTSYLYWDGTNATITGALTTSSGSSLDAQYISSSTIVNTLTMGSSGTTGYIQSYGWNGSANGFQLKGGSSPSLTIIGGTITGTTIQTSSSANTGVKMSSALGGMSVYGENIKIFDSSGTEYGSIGSGGAYFDIYAKSSRNIRITPGATSGTVFINVGSGAGIAPTTGGTGNCGLSSQYWANVYSNNYNFSTSYMNYENSGITTHTHFKPSSARSYNLGTSSYMWFNVYSDAYQVTRSGSTTRYITMNSSGNLEINTGLYVGGTLSKSAGSFTIDHPLKPDTHYLQHSFVESPDMLNIYRGNGQIANGECEIEMPDWFIPLNGEIKDDYSYQLTSIGQQNDLWVKEEMVNGKIVFAGEKDGKFSYIITAIRHDKYAEENRIQVELEKDNEKKQQYKDKMKLKDK